jgi:hypothetical protein
MSWSVSTLVSAGTLSRSTPDPSSGVAPTTSIGGNVTGASGLEGAASCAAARAGRSTTAEATLNKTCLRPPIRPPAQVSSLRTIKTDLATRRFPVLPGKSSRFIPEKFPTKSDIQRFLAVAFCSFVPDIERKKRAE